MDAEMRENLEAVEEFLQQGHEQSALELLTRVLNAYDRRASPQTDKRDAVEALKKVARKATLLAHDPIVTGMGAHIRDDAEHRGQPNPLMELLDALAALKSSEPAKDVRIEKHDFICPDCGCFWFRTRNHGHPDTKEWIVECKNPACGWEGKWWAIKAQEPAKEKP